VNNEIMISFQGSKGKQGSIETYVTMVPYRTLGNFFKVFPEVQRKINKNRVKKIAQYILDGVNNKRLTFLSAITVTCVGKLVFNNETNQIMVSINEKFSINDGQHRSAGIELAIETLQNRIEDAKSVEEKEKLTEKLDKLLEMTIPVVIFTGINQTQERQLFHDLNLLASKPTKSIALHFDSSDQLTRMAKELAANNETLKGLGIETEKTQIRSTNADKLMVLSTLRNMIAFMISGRNNDKDNILNLETYDEYYEMLDKYFNELFATLPSDCVNRQKYIIATAATLQGIGKYLHDYVFSKEGVLDEITEIHRLGNIDWSHNSKVWVHGGSYLEEKGKFIFTGTSAGINGVCDSLAEAFNKK